MAAMGLVLPTANTNLSLSDRNVLVDVEASLPITGEVISIAFGPAGAASGSG